MPAAAIIPAVAAGASIAGSAVSANQAKKAQKGQQNQINAIFQGLSPEVQGLYQQAIDSTNESYDKGASLLNSYGQEAKSNIALSGKQSLGNLTESAIGKGLGSTSYLQSLHHGITQGTAKSMSGVDEQKAALLSNLLMQKGSNLAQLYTGLAGQKANIAGNYAAQIGGVQHVSSPVNFMPYASAFGGLFGGGGSPGYTSSQSSVHDY